MPAPRRNTHPIPVHVSNDRLRDIDLPLLKGEIHGLAGLIGTAAPRFCRHFRAGRIRDRRRRDRWRSAAAAEPGRTIACGMALVLEDRHVQGLILEHFDRAQSDLPRLAYFSRWGWVQQRASVQGSGAISQLR